MEELPDTIWKCSETAYEVWSLHQWELQHPRGHVTGWVLHTLRETYSTMGCIRQDVCKGMPLGIRLEEGKEAKLGRGRNGAAKWAQQQSQLTSWGVCTKMVHQSCPKLGLKGSGFSIPSCLRSWMWATPEKSTVLRRPLRTSLKGLTAEGWPDPVPAAGL